MQPPRMGGLIQANISDRATLQASYMPYIQGGGLFIASKQAVKMGEEVFVLASLPIAIDLLFAAFASSPIAIAERAPAPVSALSPIATL